jgi:hypothetical protein
MSLLERLQIPIRRPGPVLRYLMDDFVLMEKIRGIVDQTNFEPPEKI